MFENLNRPITQEEFNRTFETAMAKLQRIIERKGANAADRYDVEYLKLLLQEQILQDRCSDEMINAYKKKAHSEECTHAICIITESAAFVKENSMC